MGLSIYMLNKEDLEGLHYLDLTPGGREVEHDAAKEARRKINDMNISEFRKMILKDELFERLLIYESEYKKFNKDKKEIPDGDFPDEYYTGIN